MRVLSLSSVITLQIIKSTNAKILYNHMINMNLFTILQLCALEVGDLLVILDD